MRPDVAFCLPTLEVGGLERWTVSLANAFAGMDHPTHVIALSQGGPLASELAPGIDVHVLGQMRTREVPRLALLLRSLGARGAILVHARWCVRSGMAASLAGVPYVPTVHTLLDSSYRWGQGWSAPEPVARALTRAVFTRSRGVAAVSAATARSVEANLGLRAGTVRTLPQPVLHGGLEALAAVPAPHPWLDRKHRPVIVTACRLAEVKDLPALIRAFAILRRARSARLIIVGAGPAEPEVRATVHAFGVHDDVLLAGLDVNPWRWVARADLFAVSSRREGMCSALVEAVALGVPVVSTDCGGPREVLEGGRWGELVRVGDPESLAVAMARALDGPKPSAEARASMWRRYGIEPAFAAYRDLLFGPP